MILAILKPLIVITGMHYALSTAFIQMFTYIGIDTFNMPATILANLGQADSTFGVFLKTKDRKLKAIVSSASLTALIGGITEPAMYGVTLKYRKTFVASMIGAGLGELYAGLTNVTFCTARFRYFRSARGSM